VIDIFIDGLSLYKKPTSKTELWPIAGRIISKGFKTKPFIIALRCGPKREPGDLDGFIGPFVKEYKELFEGFDLDGISYKLVLRNIIGDAPARACLKQVLGHRSKVSCEGCNIIGESFRKRVVFNAREIGEHRSDESFKNQTDKEYHIRRSPLEEIVNMITQFPLDRLHLLDLGATRRIFKFLLEPKVSSIKLKPSSIAWLDWLANE